MRGSVGRNSSKERAIEQAVAANDTWRLRELALGEGGFLNDSLRRRAWPVLLPAVCDAHISYTSWEFTTLTDKDRQTVRFDVERCALTADEKEQLIHVIQHSCRYYYQGYHQIASKVLKIFNHDMQQTIVILQRLYLLHFGKFIARNDLPIVRLVQLMGPPMLYCFDQELYQVMAECTTVAVGSVLTWFASSTTLDVPRLFDAFLASHSLLPFYLSFALLLSHKQIILEEPMNAHQPLQIHQGNDVEALIASSIELMTQIPPNQRLWLLTSHYYGDGAVEDLLSTAASNSLLRLVTPESSSSYAAASFAVTTPGCTASTTTTLTSTFPRAWIAAGLGRPKKAPKYKRLVAWVIAVLASACWGWRKLIQKSSAVAQRDETESPLILSPPPPPPLVNEQ